MIKECAVLSPQAPGKKKAEEDSYKYMSSLSPEMQAIAKSFTFKYGKDKEDKIEWRLSYQKKYQWNLLIQKRKS